MTDLSDASSVDVLGGMAMDEQRVLAHVAKRRRLRAGAFVYTQGDPARHFYIVESGRVRVFYQTPSGREPTVIYRGRGHLFGISHLAESGRRVTSAQALEASVIWAIANEDLDEVTQRLPTLASGIIKSLALRLRDVMVLVESVATWPARLRIANFLLADRDRQQATGAAVKEGWTHERIADRLGCTRQTVTEALNEFARKRWVRVERKRVIVIDRRALERLVSAELTTVEPRPRTPRAVWKASPSGR
jgi:CRP-like cAMP-binding protein